MHNYKQLEKEKHNVEIEVKKLEIKNEELEKENKRLYDFIINIFQTLKKLFHRLFKIGTEKYKDDVITEIKEYHKQEIYDNKDLHDIADHTSKENEISDYLYSNNYDYKNDKA